MEELREIINILKEMNGKMDTVVEEIEELKNLFVKYDLELEDYEEGIREG